MKISIINSILIATAISKTAAASKLRGTEKEDSRDLMANPASENCADNGGQEENKYDENRNEWTVCTFPDGSACEEWDFMRGDCKKGETVNFTTYCRQNSGLYKGHRIDTTGVDGATQRWYYSCQLQNGNICFEEDYYNNGYCL